MPSMVTDVGRQWIVNRILAGDSYTEQEYVAVGIGVGDVTGDREDLIDEVYRKSKERSDVTIADRLDTDVGKYTARITVSGGFDVPPDAELTEFGIFTQNEELIYLDQREPVQVINGEEVTFEIPVNFLNV